MPEIILVADTEKRTSPAPIISNAELEALGNNFVGWKRIHPDKQVTFEAYVWLMRPCEV